MKDQETIVSKIVDAQMALVETSYDQKKQRATLFSQLGDLYNQQGKLNESITNLLNALELDFDNDDIWNLFAKVVRYTEFQQSNSRAENLLLEGLKRESIHRQALAVPSLSLLKHHPIFNTFDHAIFEDQLLLTLLRTVIVPDPAFEIWITEVRKRILFGKLHPPQHFLEALAKQMVLTEYVYVETQEETQALNNHSLLPLIVNSYRQLDSLPSIESEDHIPLLQPIKDRVSKNVQNQYEEHPYPRWQHIPKTHPQTFKQVLEQALPLQHQKWDAPSHPQILIAGCGTGRQAIQAALKHANSQVVGLDISRTSLSFGFQKAKAMNIENIQFIQGDLLDLSSFKHSFDLIECSGVLHHMEAPQKGLESLLTALKPKGLLCLGLYSQLARSDIAKARNLLRSIPIPPTIEDIRNSRLKLRQDECFKDLTHSIDFYTASSCRDLLFHIQEHVFTLPQIDALLKNHDLEFLGFEFDHPKVLNDYLALFPEDSTAVSLKNWESFEKKYPQTFLGMYQFWVQRPSL